jgi:hypothetical protein
MMALRERAKRVREPAWETVREHAAPPMRPPQESSASSLMRRLNLDKVFQEMTSTALAPAPEPLDDGYDATSLADLLRRAAEELRAAEARAEAIAERAARDRVAAVERVQAAEERAAEEIRAADARIKIAEARAEAAEARCRTIVERAATELRSLEARLRGAEERLNRVRGALSDDLA